MTPIDLVREIKDSELAERDSAYAASVLQDPYLYWRAFAHAVAAQTAERILAALENRPPQPLPEVIQP